eukprot:scpid41309/ scgid16556/ Tyrosine-protein kinase Mer; Proto-oncogene c-Mer; Receptor tyrosine kinase MerTK
MPMAAASKPCGGSACRSVLLTAVVVLLLSPSHPVSSLDWCIPWYFWREIEVGAGWPEHHYNGSGLNGIDLCSNFNTSGGYERNPFKEYANTLGEFMLDAHLNWQNSPRFYWLREDSEIVLYEITISPIGAPHITERISKYLEKNNRPLKGTYMGRVLDHSFQISCSNVSTQPELWSVYYNMTIVYPIRKTLIVRVLQTVVCNTTGPPSSVVTTQEATTIPATSTVGVAPATGAAVQKKDDVLIVLLIAIAGVAVSAAAILVFVFYYRKHRKMRKKQIRSKHENGRRRQQPHPFADCLIGAGEVVPEKEIGKGAFGVVYLGTYQGESVAIKTMRVNGSVTEQQVYNFLQEAVTMKQFNHANLLNLIGVCLPENASPQIIVPYMDRGDLHTFLRNHNASMPKPFRTSESDQDMEELSSNELYAVMLQVALAMDYLSSKNFVHRDLAARNCMLDRDLIVKVGDFGLGRHMYDEQYYRANSEFMLPVKWMAPESLRYYKFTSKSDVWSFGVLMWEVESLGRIPYPGISNAEIADFVSDGNRLSQPDRCPDQLYNLMKICWQDNPIHRPTFSRILEFMEDYDRQSFYSMTTSPLYSSTAGTTSANNTFTFMTGTDDDGSTVTRTTIVPAGKPRSASCSSAAATSISFPQQPTPSVRYLPASTSVSFSNNNPSVVTHVPYSDMRSVFPQEFAPIPADVEPVMPANPAPLSYSPSPPPPPPEAQHVQLTIEEQKQLNKDALAKSPVSTLSGNDSLRQRSLSDGAASLPRPSNLYITAPLHNALPKSPASDVTSPALTIGSPASPLSTQESPGVAVSPQVGNEPQLSIPALLCIPSTASEFTPDSKTEGSIVEYQNCLSVQQPVKAVGVETDA